jgi:hypothetical protein
VVNAIKQAIGSFVSFTFSTKFLCGVNQILTAIAVIQIQNLCQAIMSKSRDLMSRNVNIQGVSAKTFEPNNSVIFQRIFVKFKMQIF